MKGYQMIRLSVGSRSENQDIRGKSDTLVRWYPSCWFADILICLTILSFVICHSSFADARQVYVGIFREGAPRNLAFIEKFEDQTDRKPAMIMWFQDWAQEFPASEAKHVIEYGAVPHIVWEAWYWGDHDKVKLNDIIAGRWDDYIRSWAAAIKEFGHPVFLRFLHEFNIEQYPWAIVNNEKDPKKLIEAYRRTVNIFKKERVDNVKWIWCFNNYSFPDEPWNDWPPAYPGDEYVDWIGIDGYNWGTTQTWSGWEDFKGLFRNQVRRAKKLWPTKPIMAAEFASTEQGGSKAAWIKEIPGYLKTSLRDIDAIIWFDHKKETDWQLTSSPSALAAFKSIMADPIFSSSSEGLAKLIAARRETVKTIVVAKKITKPIKIDGHLCDFPKKYPLTMKGINFLKEGLSWKGPADLSGTVYLSWDDQYFYLGAQIVDNHPLMNNKEKQDIWNGDAIEITLSTDPKADSRRESFERSDYQIGFSAGNGKTIKPQIWCWQRRRSPAGSEIVVKKTVKPAGYTLEAKIPWAFFPTGFVPSAGTRVGFDLALDDADASGERERQMIWNGDYLFYKDPSVWGVLEFR